MPVSSDGNHVGPFPEIVRWRLARYGFLCVPAGDGALNGIIGYLEDGTAMSRERALWPGRSAELTKVVAGRSNRLPIEFGNRYWSNKQKTLSWWGSPSKYRATMNLIAFRWTPLMSPDDFLTGYQLQPTRYAEHFLGDYFWLNPPPDFNARGPYQVWSIERDGNFCQWRTRPMTKHVYLQSKPLYTSPDSWMPAGAGIVEMSSGTWAIVVEQTQIGAEADRVHRLRLDGSERETLATYEYPLSLDHEQATESDSWEWNLSPWIFSPDGIRAVTLRETIAPNESDRLIAERAGWELVITEDTEGKPSVTRNPLPVPALTVDDWIVTPDKGLRRVTENDALTIERDYRPLPLFEGYLGLPDDRPPWTPLDYDPDGTLRQIWGRVSRRYDADGGYWTGTGAPSLLDDQSVACNQLRVDHLDVREELLVGQLLRQGDERYVVWWRGHLVWSTTIEKSTEWYPDEGFGVSTDAPTVCGCAAVSADGQYMALSLPIIEWLARIPWDPISYYYHTGNWWDKRRFEVGVWRYDEETDTISRILDADAIAEVAGVAKFPNLRINPVIPS